VTGSSETCGTPPDRLEVSAGHMCAWCDPSLLRDLLDVGVTWRFMAFRGSADSVLVGSPAGTAYVQTWEDQRENALQEAAPLQLMLTMYTVARARRR
jgi:hypothetical protein